MERLKFIIDEVNKMFNSDYNCSSFTSLSSPDLLQLVVGVMTNIEIMQERETAQNQENAAFEILNTLEAIKYIPDQKIYPADFRNGLAEADTTIIYPILEFLLKNSDNVKKRHYLSKFVNPIEIPQEIITDEKVTSLYESYTKLIEEFWRIYSENKQEKTNALEAAELENDIWQMNSDLNNLEKHLEAQQQKLGKDDGIAERLERTQQYCEAMKRNEKLQNQIREDRDKLDELQETIRRYERRDRIETLEDLLERSEHHKYSHGMYEAALAEVINDMEIFQVVDENVEPSDDELEQLHESCHKLQMVVNELYAEKESKTDATVVAYLNQIKALKKKKMLLSKQIMKLRLNNEEVLGKSDEICALLGGDVLQGRNLKEYVANLRQRSVVYKQRKVHLNGLITEYGILSRTLDVLYLSDATLKEKLQTKIEFLNNLDEDCKNLSEFEQRSKFRQKYKDYERLKGEFLVEESKYNKIKTIYTEMNTEHKTLKVKFEEATGNLTNDIIKIQEEVEKIEQWINLENEDLNKYERDIDYYRDCMLRYSQGIIECAGDTPFVDIVKEKLRYLEDENVTLHEQMAQRRLEAQQEEQSLEEIRSTMKLIACKMQSSPMLGFN